jgi:TolB protein
VNPPVLKGKIVFQTNRDGNAEIYVMNADGTNRVNLTRHPGEDVTPHWSPEGGRIAFASNRDGNFEILTMNDDGSGVAQLTATSANNRWPRWTNDGRIVFQTGTFPNRDLYVMNADGASATNLTPGPLDSAWAAPAPRGSWIAFSRFSEAEGQRLYTMNTITRKTKLVTLAPPEVADVQASWAPRGNDLVFARLGNTGSELFAVHKDGTHLTQLTNTPARTEFQPGFSPDGAMIVFNACSGLGTDQQHCANYIMNTDGTGETEVSTPRIPYLDTFSDTRIDPFWHSILSGTGSHLAQTNGRLEETFAADAAQGGPYNNIDAHVGSNCKLAGDFDVQADYNLLAWPAANGVQVALNAFEPGSQVLRESQVWGEQYGTWIPPTFSSVLTSDLSGSLRLTRVGTTITGYYRNGLTWVPVASGTTTLDDATLGLSASSFMDRFAHQTVNIAWDNFRINNGTFSCPTWWTDSAPDWQPVAKR